MKKYIFLSFIFSLVFGSCVYEDIESSSEINQSIDYSYKDLNITIDTGFPETITKAGEAGDANVVGPHEVKIEKVRLCYCYWGEYLSSQLFTNLGSTSGTVTLKASVPKGNLPRFTSNDIDIIAVVNEPTGFSKYLETYEYSNSNLSLAMLHFKYTLGNYMTSYICSLNNDKTNTWPVSNLPFVGNVNINIDATSNLTIPVKRCVSRVDVYFSKASSLTSTIKLTNANTSFTVSGISKTGSLGNGFESLVAVKSTADKLNNDLTLTTTPQRAYYFYMAPIGTNKVNPTMTINNVFYSDYNYYKDFKVTDFINSAIKPNNIYRIYCTIGSGGEISISNITISDWSDIAVDGNIHGGDIIIDGEQSGKTFPIVAAGANKTIKIISRGDLSMSRFVGYRRKIYEYYKYSNSQYTKMSNESNLGELGDFFTLTTLPAWLKGGISLTYIKTFNGLKYYNLSVTNKGNTTTYGSYEAVTSTTTPKPPTGATHRRLRIEERWMYIYLKCDCIEKVIGFRTFL